MKGGEKRNYLRESGRCVMNKRILNVVRYIGDVITKLPFPKCICEQITAFLHVTRLKFIIGYLGKSINFSSRLRQSRFRILFTTPCNAALQYVATTLSVPKVFYVFAAAKKVFSGPPNSSYAILWLMDNKLANNTLNSY